MEPSSPSACRYARRNTARIVIAVRIARGEYQGWPVCHLVLLPRDVVAGVLVQLEGQEGHPVFGRVIPYVTLCLSTTAQPMHHARVCD